MPEETQEQAPVENKNEGLLEQAQEQPTADTSVATTPTLDTKLVIPVTPVL